MTQISQELLNKALVAAAGSGRMAQVGLLLRQGAAPDAGRADSPALFAAAAGNHDVCLRLLIKAGADVNARNAKGSTALMIAAFHGHLEAMRTLLDSGADRFLKNRDGQDAAGYARLQGHSSAEALLLRDADEVVHKRPLGNRILEETFNFRTRERISLIRKGPEQPVEAIYRESFARIGDTPALREAFDTYRARGGKRTEEEIFPERMGKKPVDRKTTLRRRPE